MKNIIKYLLAAVVLTFAGCDEGDMNNIYDNPFIYLGDAQGMSSVNVSSVSEFTGEYYLYLSSRKLDHDVTVSFVITAGDGLIEGVDYELTASAKSPKVFPMGIYKMPIRINWLPHELNPAKDNTLTITLTGNSDSFTMGFPGPSQNNKSLTITKK